MARSDSTVVKLSRRFRAALLRRDRDQMVIMAQEWLKVEGSLNSLIDNLILDINARAEAGQVITRGKILRLERYQQLKRQAIDEYLKYDEFAIDLVTAGQGEVAQIGLNESARLVQEVVLSENIVSVGSFNRLGVEATQFMVGQTGAGSPLSELILKSVAFDTETQMRIIDTLTRSTALGYNPRKTARLIRTDMAMDLNKAMQIARTEQLRVYRESSRMNYEESDVVKGYKRIASKSGNTCPACLMADGTIYRTSTQFEEHPQGRCSLIPIVIGAPVPEWETGMEWFKKQDKETQTKILGPGRYDAWKDNQFELEDLITKKTNKTWGNSLVPTPLKKLVN